MFERRLKKRFDSMLDVHYEFCHDKKLKYCIFLFVCNSVALWYMAFEQFGVF